MDTVKLSIDGRQVEVPAGTTILEAASKAGIYIPTLCYHPDLPPAKNGVAAAAIYQGAQRLGNAMPQEPGQGCGLCAVEVKGQNDLAGSCAAAAEAGMIWMICINPVIAAGWAETFPPPDVKGKPLIGFAKFIVEIFSLKHYEV